MQCSNSKGSCLLSLSPTEVYSRMKYASRFVFLQRIFMVFLTTGKYKILLLHLIDQYVRHHQDCFWSMDHDEVTETSILGFSALRYDDQKRIRLKIAEWEDTKEKNVRVVQRSRSRSESVIILVPGKRQCTHKLSQWFHVDFVPSVNWHSCFPRILLLFIFRFGGRNKRVLYRL